jgi:Flp pilus assembly protein CpaB
MIKKSIPSYYLLIGTVICALLAAFVAVKGFNKYTTAVPVVVMAIDKPAFSKLDPSDLKIVQVSKSALQTGMFSGTEPVLGKFTKTFIPAGTLLSKNMLAEEKIVNPSSDSSNADTVPTENPLALSLTELKHPELRAYTIPVDQIQGLGGNIVAGDKIDVTGAMKLPLGVGSSEQPVAKTIARGRTVLGIVKNSNQICGVTIAVSPQEAQDVIFALLNGRVSVGLNPYDSDQRASDTLTTTSQTFIQKYINGTPPTSQPVNKTVIPVAGLVPVAKSN